MKRTIAVCVIALAAMIALSLAGRAGAQAPILAWSFNEDAGSWQSMDPTGHVLVTTDANVIRSEEAGGVLEHAYTPAIGVISAMLSPIETGLTGGQSLRYWIKTTDYAMVATALAENDGSRYVATFASLPDQWQEVALGFSEFELSGDTEDENGKLDPEQVQVVMLGDLTSFLAQAAQAIPFIVPPDLGPRMMWLDEFSVNSEPVEPRWEQTDIAGIRAVRLDGFESWPLHWFILAGKGVEVAYDGERKSQGELSLRLRYDLPAGKAFGALTPLYGVPLHGMRNLSLAVMSEMPTLLFVELKEADESKYQTAIPIKALNDFETLQISLEELPLGNDSSDENGRLDMDQVKELTIADVSAMGEQPVTVNTLWIDDVLFSE
jgi:hypothetical protein